MDWKAYYDALDKPIWTPPPETISLIWMCLYPIIAISFGFVLVQAIRGKMPRWLLIPLAVNLTANLLFTPIFFSLRNLPLAAVDILVVWGSIIWIAAGVWRHSKWVAVAQVPYFVWVTIATVIQLQITWNNSG